ncbi:MAG: DUF982 domain-containing protein [Methylobacterium mesophilicum]|nr:DUF982 domain-containing protein [Methylobacterium mesophilicum]
MRNLEFPSPVHVQRFGQPVEIETVDEALALLMFWPASRRGNAFHHAISGCEAALEGALTVGEAREALAEFVDVTGSSTPTQHATGGTGPVAAAGGLFLKH